MSIGSLLLAAYEKRFLRRIVAVVAGTAILLGSPVGAATDNQLKPIRGTAGYRLVPGTPLQPATAIVAFPDAAYAVTEAASNALLILTDTSEIALGPLTTVQVKNPPTPRDPTNVALAEGAIRFNIHHPANQASNYIITTPRETVSIHGSIGLVSSGPSGDIVACLSCEENDVLVTAGNQQFKVKTGQQVAITAAAAATVGVITVALLDPFIAAALSTTATSATAFVGAAAGANAGTAAAGAAAAHGGIGATAAIAGGAVAVGVIAAVAGSGGAKSSPAAAPVAPTPVIAVSPGTLSFTATGQAQTFTASGTTGITASSANAAIATVSGSGPFTVTAVGGGSTTIAVSAPGAIGASVAVSIVAANILPSSKAEAHATPPPAPLAAPTPAAPVRGPALPATSPKGARS